MSADLVVPHKSSVIFPPWAEGLPGPRQITHPLHSLPNRLHSRRITAIRSIHITTQPRNQTHHLRERRRLRRKGFAAMRDTPNLSHPDVLEHVLKSSFLAIRDYPISFFNSAKWDKKKLKICLGASAQLHGVSKPNTSLFKKFAQRAKFFSEVECEILGDFQVIRLFSKKGGGCQQTPPPRFSTAFPEKTRGQVPSLFLSRPSVRRRRLITNSPFLLDKTSKTPEHRLFGQLQNLALASHYGLGAKN